MNEKSFTSSAPGKIHLAGEHGSVYGKPALLAAINLRCKTTLTVRNDIDEVIEIVNKQMDLREITSLHEITSFTQTARSMWQEFEKTNDVSVLKAIAPHDIDLIKIAVGETLSYIGKELRSGFSLVVDSEIPIGVGLGSSAAVATSVARVLGDFLEYDLGKSALYEIVYQCESRKHGFSSGGDIYAVIQGGLVWYERQSGRRTDVDFTAKARSIYLDVASPILGENLTLIQTGRPAASTGEIVSLVRERYNQKPMETQAVFDGIEICTKEMLNALRTNDFEAFCNSVNGCQHYLDQLGVVTDFAQEIIGKIRNMGGAAKISGAGGIGDKAVGVILAFHPEPQKIVALADQVGLPSFAVEAGVESVL